MEGGGWGTLSRQERRHRGTLPPGPGTPTLMMRGAPAGASAGEGPANSPSGSSSTAGPPPPPVRRVSWVNKTEPHLQLAFWIVCAFGRREGGADVLQQFWYMAQKLTSLLARKPLAVSHHLTIYIASAQYGPRGKPSQGRNPRGCQVAAQTVSCALLRHHHM